MVVAILVLVSQIVNLNFVKFLSVTSKANKIHCPMNDENVYSMLIDYHIW